MRLIDADATPDMGISNFSVMFRKVIDSMPTVDLWHYLSKGELPPMDTRVYLWMKGDVFPVVAKRHDFKRHDEEWSWDCYWGSGFILKHNDERIVAWQYIVPPREEV